MVCTHETRDADINHKTMHSRGGGGAQLTTSQGRVGPARKGGSSERPAGVTWFDAVQRGRATPARCSNGESKQRCRSGKW
jgi:hypothetical protein